MLPISGASNQTAYFHYEKIYILQKKLHKTWIEFQLAHNNDDYRKKSEKVSKAKNEYTYEIWIADLFIVK